MKKGMLFCFSHREKRVKKINLLHFPVFTSKNFVILKFPEPSTDCFVCSLLRFACNCKQGIIGIDKFAKGLFPTN